MALQPFCNRLNIAVGCTKLLAEFIRREPFMKIRRRGGLQLFQKLNERRLPLGTALQYQQHAFHGQTIGRRALIELFFRQRMLAARHTKKLSGIDGGRNQTGSLSAG